MIYTSNFSSIAKIEQIKPNIKFISIAGKTPDTLLSMPNLSLYRKLMPKYDWWCEWHETFKNDPESEESKKFYIDHYYRTVLSKLDPEKTVNELKSLSNGEDVCLLCYETADKFCHRHLVADWLCKAGIECIELLKTHNINNQCDVEGL